MLSQKDVLPVGKVAPSNWHRYGESDVDSLLEKLEATPDKEEQNYSSTYSKSICCCSSAIPLFLNPSWGEYNTTILLDGHLKTILMLEFLRTILLKRYWL